MEIIFLFCLYLRWRALRTLLGSHILKTFMIAISKLDKLQEKL